MVEDTRQQCSCLRRGGAKSPADAIWLEFLDGTLSCVSQARGSESGHRHSIQRVYEIDQMRLVGHTGGCFSPRFIEFMLASASESWSDGAPFRQRGCPADGTPLAYFGCLA